MISIIIVTFFFNSMNDILYVDIHTACPNNLAHKNPKKHAR